MLGYTNTRLLGSGGLTPELIVTSSIGSTVTANGKSPTRTESNKYIFENLLLGTYEIIADTPGGIATKTVSITSVRQYRVSVAPYDYGDGSLNDVPMGYEGKLYVNGKLARWKSGTPYYDATNGTNRFNTWAIGNESYGYTYLSEGEILLINGFWLSYPDATEPDPSSVHPNIGSDEYMYIFHEGICHHTSYSSSHPSAYIPNGTNTIELHNLYSATEDLTVMTEAHGGAYTSSVAVGNFSYTVDGNVYTLKQMVDNEIVKPLVVIASNGSNGNYYFPTSKNIYTGGNTSTGNFASLVIWFMLNAGHNISAVTIYSSKAFSTSYDDGLTVASVPTEKCRLTLNAY